MTKEEICNMAYELMQALNRCEDDYFVDSVIDAIGYNDEFALSDLLEDVD